MRIKSRPIIAIFLGVLILSSAGLVYLQLFTGRPSEFAILETSIGLVEIELFRDKAPTTVDNFIRYINDKFYDGTVFHRVMSGFVIQGGGFTSNSTQKTTRAPIKLEAGASNKAGTIAMARTSDPNSATSQFFINLVDNSKSLDLSQVNAGYAVFGTVGKGMDVVNTIASIQTETRQVYFPQYNQTVPFDDWPVEDVVIIKAYMKK